MHFGGGEDEAGADRGTSGDADADPKDPMHVLIYCMTRGRLDDCKSVPTD